MKLPIAPLVHKNLESTAHFVAVGAKDEVKGYEKVLQAGEDIVGWYENPPPLQSLVIFTDRALLFSKEGSTWRLPYRHITSWRPNNDDRAEVTALEVQCGGEWVTIEFSGRQGDDGETVDAFSFANVLSTMIRAPREQLVA